METVKVTFKSENREIVIDFNLDKENGNLDYNTTIEPPFNDESEINDGSLVIYLANMFMQSLVPSQEFNESAE